MPSSLYEQYVSMIINCMPKCAFAVIATGLIETIFFMAVFSAHLVKPVCVFTLLFNFFIVLLAVMLVQNTLSFLRQLAFAETIAEKMLEPNTNGAVVMPEGNAVIKFSTSDHSNLDGIVKMIIALQKTDKNVAASHVDGDDKKDATTPVNNNSTNDTSAATVTTTTITSDPSVDTTTKFPSTPASECSQADTEICKASLAKEED